VHVQVTPVRIPGGVSATVAPFATLGPALVATMVYVTGVPGTAVVWPSDFVMERSALKTTLMQPVPVMNWPSGLVSVTFLEPAVVGVTLRVTDVGLL
jgi:hypothetical protein